jgi:hypothetical protein
MAQHELPLVAQLDADMRLLQAALATREHWDQQMALARENSILHFQGQNQKFLGILAHGMLQDRLYCLFVCLTVFLW